MYFGKKEIGFCTLFFILYYYQINSPVQYSVPASLDWCHHHPSGRRSQFCQCCSSSSRTHWRTPPRCPRSWPTFQWGSPWICARPQRKALCQPPGVIGRIWRMNWAWPITRWSLRWAVRVAARTWTFSVRCTLHRWLCRWKQQFWVWICTAFLGESVKWAMKNSLMCAIFFLSRLWRILKKAILLNLHTTFFFSKILKRSKMINGLLLWWNRIFSLS